MSSMMNFMSALKEHFLKQQSDLPTKIYYGQQQSGIDDSLGSPRGLTTSETAHGGPFMNSGELGQIPNQMMPTEEESIFPEYMREGSPYLRQKGLGSDIYPGIESNAKYRMR